MTNGHDGISGEREVQSKPGSIDTTVDFLNFPILRGFRIRTPRSGFPPHQPGVSDSESATPGSQRTIPNNPGAGCPRHPNPSESKSSPNLKLIKLGMCLVTAALLIAGCNRTGTARTIAPPKAAPADPWVLTTLDPTGGAPAYLSNGLIGVRLSRAASGLGPDKKPLSFLMIDEYQPDGEEKILPMPNPVLTTMAVGNDLFQPGKDGHDFLKSGGTPLDPTAGKDYKQCLDMRTGVLTTQWTQSTPNGNVDLKVETVVHPQERTLAQRWTLITAKPLSFSLKTLDYSGPNDEQQPVGEDTKSGVIISASSKRVVTTSWRGSSTSLGARVQVGGFTVQEGTTLTGQASRIERVVSFGAHSDKPLPTFGPTNVNDLRKLTPTPRSFDEVEQAAKRWWAERWKCDIQIDGPVEDQQAVRSFLFYMRSSINVQGKMAVSPFALSDTQYNGHVFWDADIWVFPGLALTDPDLARTIPAYRSSRFKQAELNDFAWNLAKRPIVGGLMGLENRPDFEERVRRNRLYPRYHYLKFPWESSVSGRETTPGPSQFEEHISGSVAWSVGLAHSLGLVNDQTREDVICGVDGHYRSRRLAGANKKWEIRGVMSPDENHVGDNDLYTNLLARWVAHEPYKGPESNPNITTVWYTDEQRNRDLSAVYKLPQDKTSFLTYDNDTLKAYKQAAAVLSIYPLQYPPAEKQARVMMQRFSDKVIKNGPAMTDSVHALIWARLQEPEKAYVFWRGSWEPFTKNPLLLFSEKRGKPTSYFVTGAGGSLQSILYGFLGFRIDSSAEQGASWSKKLRGDSWLSIRPNLPKAWKSVTFKGFSVLGSRYTLTASQSAVRVKQGD